jgi:ribosomal protein S18 acetylase RimI-like enzyme
MLIRKAIPEDAAQIVAVLEGIAAERIHSAITNPWTAGQQRQYLLSLSNREAFHVAIAPDGGLAGYQSLDLYSPYLDSMSHVAQVGTFLHPRFRGKGVGRALFAATREFATQAAYRKIVIQVRGSNGAAQSFYRKLGFTPCGRLTAQVLIDGVPDDEILMELFL